MTTLIFDTETTGLPLAAGASLDRQPHVIEMFALVVDHEFQEIERHHGLYNPGFRLPRKIVEITGITDDRLRGLRPFHVDGLQRFTALASGAGEVVGHNLAFDMQMVEFAHSRAQAAHGAGAGARGSGLPWPRRRICTVDASIAQIGYREKLGDMYERMFGMRFSGAHRAEADVLALLKIFQKLRETGEV